MLGPYVNGAAVLVGGLAGAFLGPRIGKNLRDRMPVVFGYSSIGLGVAMIIKVKALAPMILALVLGSLLGEILQLEGSIQKVAFNAKRLVEKVAKAPAALSQEEFLEKFVALMILVCASSTGIFGAMNEGITGDPALLIVKSILDLFTAAIFAATLGYTVATLALPLLVIQDALFYGATLILPLTTPAMTADFSACGGLILLATGCRICGIKQYPVANMLPALFLVMPLSALWTRFFG